MTWITSPPQETMIDAFEAYWRDVEQNERGQYPAHMTVKRIVEDHVPLEFQDIAFEALKDVGRQDWDEFLRWCNSGRG